MERTVADPQDGRQRIPALSRFEEEAKFTRAIRVGDRIIVAGNVASGETAGEQATRCFEQIVDYLQQLGGQSGDVVRVRMFVTDIADAEAVTAAFTKAVGHARPAGTLVAVAALAAPIFKVEIEADAVIGAGQ